MTQRQSAQRGKLSPSLPAVSKSSDQSYLRDAQSFLAKTAVTVPSWETEKLRHSLDIKAIPYNNRLSPLLPRYIPTLAAIERIAATSAFVAFDTESVPHCYKTTDVGLAFLPELSHTCSSGDNKPTLDNFVKDHRVKAISFKINGRFHNINKRLKAMSPHQRPMEHLRFGKEEFVDIEDLDVALSTQIERFRRAVPEKELILVGLSLQSDFERLCLEFPGIARLFSGWIDLSTLMKAESPNPPKTDTGLGTALKTFNYPYSDTGFNSRHQAANDAVRTLAALNGLMEPQNVTKLLLRQHEFVGIEIAPQVDHFEAKTYRALVHVNGKSLPPSIDSAQKLAFAVQKFKPIGVAADNSNAKNAQAKNYPTSIHTPQRTCGCVCFKGNKDLENFISATNGQKHDNMVLKVVRAPLPQHIRLQIAKGRSLKTKRKNRRRIERNRKIEWAEVLKNLFLTDDELGDEWKEEEKEEEKASREESERSCGGQIQNDHDKQADKVQDADIKDGSNGAIKEPIQEAIEHEQEANPKFHQNEQYEVKTEQTHNSSVNEEMENQSACRKADQDPQSPEEEIDTTLDSKAEAPETPQQERPLWTSEHGDSPLRKRHEHNGPLLSLNPNLGAKKRSSWLSKLARKVFRKRHHAIAS
ncbi:hypothetical protein F5Y19DRAFT_217281 [Xylariaceae sp. FL1651]|nr:hypothetical protein F5Y19DRAFT_217281 [Xylariaceae sp. FL1651]